MLHSSYHVSATAARNLEGPAAAYPAPRKARPLWTARFGQCVVRTACREVFVDGEASALQPRAFELLTYLIEHRDRVVSADELLDNVWRTEEVQLGSLAAAIMRVRRALREESHGRGSMIRTYAKFGYRFVAPTTIDFQDA
ncbi:MAG: transcriptional regulator [Vitreoscilla sp.]|jgi:DNA-binding winged helix-turn-helix (wHTH) protein